MPPFVLGAKLYFTAFNSMSRTKLYSYDGAVVAQAIQELGPGFDEGVTNYIISGDKLYFLGMNPSFEYKMYSYDGARLVQVSNGIGDNSAPDTNILEGAAYAGEVYFTVATSHSYKVTKYDGTFLTEVSNTTTQESRTDGATNYLVCGNKLFFEAYDSAFAYKLFAYDGQSVEQKSVEQISNTTGDPSASDVDGYEKVCMGDILYFVANKVDATPPSLKLFSYDGAKVTQITNVSGSDSVTDALDDLMAINGVLFFTARGKVFSYDGSQLHAISDMQVTKEGGEGIVGYDQGVYFEAFAPGSSSVKKLFVFDGSSVVQVSNTSGSASVSDSPTNFIVYDKRLFFDAVDPSGHRRIYSLCDSTSGCTP
jgi:hypothetical protein